MNTTTKTTQPEGRVSRNGTRRSKTHLNKPIVIESISPVVDGGQYTVKAVVGDRLPVEADIFRAGEDVIKAVVKYRRRSDLHYREEPMACVDNDRWRGFFSVNENTHYRYTIEAWTDHFATWQNELRKRVNAGLGVQSEIKEGVILIEDVLVRARGEDRNKLERLIWQLCSVSQRGPEALNLALGEDATEIMSRLQRRSGATLVDPEIDVFVDRSLARFGTWYEMFVRSQGNDPAKSGTFADAEARLPEIHAMGFDVVYLAPIHPVGRTARKGPNNSLTASPDDPGCPWAVGNEFGGHTAIDPSLGTFDDFDRFVRRARSLGMEIAMDFAIQCSPDHPWVREHPEWFYRRPDGTIKYAENPPMRYEDIYPLNFESEKWPELWDEMKSVVMFWVARGINIFRVDNPHTKPQRFWRWLIEEIQAEHPGVLFLAEAFTRPKPMKGLSKAGFSQSYTYFIWRNTKKELTEYMNELTDPLMMSYYRPNFFTTTPDVLPGYLQTGGRPAFKARYALAATLSPTCGMIAGYELCENEVIAGTDEYANSEKFEIRVRDWNKPGHIKDFIDRVNRARRKNKALQGLDGLRFLDVDNDQLIAFVKTSADRSNAVVVVVNLDPFHPQAGTVVVPPEALGLAPGSRFGVRDALTDARFVWGEQNFVRLDPNEEPAHVLEIEKQV